MIARKIRKLAKIVAPSAQSDINQAQIDAAIAADNARDDATYLKLADAAGFLERFNDGRTNQLGLPQFGQFQIIGSTPSGSANERDDIDLGDWHPGTYLTAGDVSSGNFKSDKIYSGKVEITISGFGVASINGQGTKLIDAFYDHERLLSAFTQMDTYPFGDGYAGNGGVPLYPNQWPMGNGITPAPSPGVQLTAAQIAQISDAQITKVGAAWGWYALNGTIDGQGAGTAVLLNAGIRRLQLQVETSGGDNSFEAYHATNTDYNDQFAIANINTAAEPLQAKTGGLPVPNYTHKNNWVSGGGQGSSASNFYDVVNDDINELYQGVQSVDHLQPYKGVLEYKFIHDLGVTPSKLKFRLAPHTGYTETWHPESRFWVEIKPVDGEGQEEQSL
jgi:hypothetical protein